MSDRAHKLSSKLFTEVKLESCSLTAFHRTEDCFATQNIALWWPLKQMQV